MKLPVVFFFIAYLVLGLTIVSDYGVGPDEVIQRYTGFANLNYVIGNDHDLLVHKDRYYGPFFEMILAGFEAAFNFTANPHLIFLSRHILNFLCFYLSVIFFFRLCQERFGDWRISLFGCLLLVLTPRIFADAFYNSKDIIFLSFVIFSIYTLSKFIKTKSLRTAIWHGVLCGLLIDIRVLGVFVPLLTGVWYLFDVIFHADLRIKKSKQFFYLLIYTIILCATVYIFRPILWHDPINGFLAGFYEMKQYPWNQRMLYLGEVIGPKQIPWHYIPIWMLITIPAGYTLLFVFGLARTVSEYFKRPFKFSFFEKFDLMAVAWFFCPILAVIILKSVVYDAWRHLFFVYPAFVILALKGVKVCLDQFVTVKKNKVRLKVLVGYVFFIFIIGNIVNVVGFMITQHPFQNVYFNVFAGRDYNQIRQKFEMDYWGISFKRALEQFLATIDDEKINLIMPNPPFMATALLLEKRDQERINVCLGGRQYFFTHYRAQPNNHVRLSHYGPRVFSSKVKGAVINGVYEMHDVRDPSHCLDILTYMNHPELLTSKIESN